MNPIEQLFENGPQTRAQLGISQFRIERLVEKGEVKRLKVTEKVTDASGNPTRGRPRFIYNLSDKSRKRMKREAAKA